MKTAGFGRHYETDSFVHRLDPRAKMTALFALFIAIFLFDSPWGLLGLLAVSLGTLILSRVPLRIVLSALAPLAWVLIFPLLINLFTVHEGDLLVNAGVFSIYSRGLYLAVFMTMRLFVLLLLAVTLTLTTSPIALCDGAERMMAPFERFGLPTHELAMITSIALRFIPLLFEEALTIKRAQMARGASFETGSVGARLKATAAMIVPLFSISFSMAEDLALAMESRCYHGGEGRTHYHELRMRACDFVTMALAVAILVLSVFF